MPDAIALGDINVDIIAHFARYPDKGEDALAYSTEIHCGGSAANTAMALSRMGIRASLIGRVGPDSWALKALSSLEDAGVDPRGLQRDRAAMTGLMYVIVTPDGERTILGHRGANVFTEAAQIREEYIQESRLFHLSGYALLTEPQRSAALLALEMACRHNLTVTLDPGMSVSKTARDAIRAVLPVIDILLPNLPEAQDLTGREAPDDCAQALVDAGVQTVALKLGREGCLIANKDSMERVPAFAIDTRDSTGAGDSFAAGFIAGLLGGVGLQGAAVLGNALGAMSAAQVGAATAFPKAREVLTLLREHHHEPTHCKCVDAIQQAIDYVTALATEPKEEGQPWWV
jgi:ribokinase